MNAADLISIIVLGLPESCLVDTSSAKTSEEACSLEVERKGEKFRIVVEKVEK